MLGSDDNHYSIVFDVYYSYCMNNETNKTNLRQIKLGVLSYKDISLINI